VRHHAPHLTLCDLGHKSAYPDRAQQYDTPHNARIPGGPVDRPKYTASTESPRLPSRLVVR
jgi:hypothetical protein